MSMNITRTIKFYENVMNANTLAVDEEVILVFDAEGERSLFRHAKVLGYDVGFLLMEVSKHDEEFDMFSEKRLVRVIDEDKLLSKAEMAELRRNDFPVLRT